MTGKLAFGISSIHFPSSQQSGWGRPVEAGRVDGAPGQASLEPLEFDGGLAEALQLAHHGSF